jgi:hypothetical protein
VNRLANNTLKAVATLLSTAVAFGLGFVGVWNYYERWVLPDMVQKYPRDGQIGLEQFVYALEGGCAVGLVAFLVGIFWIAKTSRSCEIGSGQRIS